MADPKTLKAVALIPARSGSVRVPHKNIRRLGGHPLIAYTIAAARASGVFEAVVVSTDSEDYARIARHYGAEVPFLRGAEMAGSTSPDIAWVLHALDALEGQGRSFDAFSILRPTSPFRKPETIQRAWAAFTGADGIDSLRAVEPVEIRCSAYHQSCGPLMSTPSSPSVRKGTSTVPAMDEVRRAMAVQAISSEAFWT